MNGYLTDPAVFRPGPEQNRGPARRLGRFILVLGLALVLVYGVLPWMTGSFSLTRRMAGALEETGIDPSRYYYTDVDQVLEAEQYLRTVLDSKNR